MENQDQGNDHSSVHTKIMNRRGSERSFGGIGAMSTRSEEDVFSDAVTEFQDSALDSAEPDKLLDLTPAISFKDCEEFDTLQSSLDSAYERQKENPVLKSMPILPIDTTEQDDVGLSYGKDSGDKSGSAGDVVSIKMETVKGGLGEWREADADANENEDSKLNKNLSSVSVQPSKHAGEISESESILEKRLDVTSDMVQLKEEFNDRLPSNAPMSGNGEQEMDGEGNPKICFGENMMDASLKSKITEDLTSETGVELEKNSDKLVLNMVIDDLSTKAESAKDIKVPTDTCEIQTDAAHVMDSSIAVDSDEIGEKKEKESVYVLSIPGDIPVVDDAEIKLLGFKDHKGVKLFQSNAVDSEEIIIDKEDEVKDCASQEKSDTFVSNPMDEGIVTEDSYKFGVNNEVKDRASQEKSDTFISNPMDEDIVTEDCYKLGEKNEAIVKEVLFVGNADTIQIDKGSDAFSPVDADTTKNEKDREVRSLIEQQTVYVADDLHHDVPDVKHMVTDTEAEKLNNVPGEENNAKYMGTSCEFSNSSLHTIPASDLLEVEDSDDVRIRKTQKYNINEVEGGEEPEGEHVSKKTDSTSDVKTRKIQKYNINEVEGEEGPEGEHVSVKTDSTSESISTHRQSVIVTELNEPEGPQSDRVSNCQDDKKESETNSYNKVHGESAIENLIVAAVENSEQKEIKRTSVDQLKKELIHSGAVSGNHTTESGAASSQTSAVILQGEANSRFVNPQLNTTVGDVSIDSSSQTDSLEGHWGSISEDQWSVSSPCLFLSTQSDNPAAIDTETQPSIIGSQALSEAEKANIKSSKEQHFDISDEFEPPSFMTLVEGGSDPKDATVSETPAGQNAENPRAGWFPSRTHVANESHGRKKNEKIIEKVANWNINRHSTLKNLANSEPNDGTMGDKVSSTVGKVGHFGYSFHVAHL